MMDWIEQAGGWWCDGYGVWWHPQVGHVVYCGLCGEWVLTSGRREFASGGILDKVLKVVLEKKREDAQARTKAIGTLQRMNASPGWCAPPNGPMTEKDIQQMANCASDYWNAQMQLGPAMDPARGKFSNVVD